MSARSKARKRALDVLFESEARGLRPDGTLEDRLEAARAGAQPPVADHTVRLVRGVAEHQERIDELLTTYAEGWALDRMPAVDRNVLRIGVYEVLYADDVPDAVAVDEAVTMVRDLSTDESPAFVNGVLGAVVRDKGALGTPAG
jgi:N utilization substance protein B